MISADINSIHPPVCVWQYYKDHTIKFTSESLQQNPEIPDRMYLQVLLKQTLNKTHILFIQYNTGIETVTQIFIKC